MVLDPNDINVYSSSTVEGDEAIVLCLAGSSRVWKASLKDAELLAKRILIEAGRIRGEAMGVLPRAYTITLED